MTVLEAGTRNVIVTYPDESLHDTSAKMLRNNVGRLPVVAGAILITRLGIWEGRGIRNCEI